MRKMHWCSWDKVTLPKTKGGLGLSRLSECNDALILKWLWRYRTEPESMWKKVIDSIHSMARQWESYPALSSGGGV